MKIREYYTGAPKLVPEETISRCAIGTCSLQLRIRLSPPFYILHSPEDSRMPFIFHSSEDLSTEVVQIFYSYSSTSATCTCL